MSPSDIYGTEFRNNLTAKDILFGKCQRPGVNVSTGATGCPIKYPHYPSLHVCDCIKINYLCASKANELAIWHAFV
jgi:hypothetical protein